MSEIVTAIGLLINSFSKYAGKEGDTHTLTKGELKDLLQNELRELLDKANDQASVDRIFKDLDMNQDNTVDFKEFGNMILGLAIACHGYFSSKK